MLKPKPYTYQTSLSWGGQRKGTTGSVGKPDIAVACPPEFGGHVGMWSPEELFVASVELCVMTTFLFLLKKRGLVITSYESSARGTAQMNSGVFEFTDILVKPAVTIPDGSQTGEIEGLFGETLELCLISNSIKPQVKLAVSILIDADEAR